jgi:hypothetical protein
LSLNRALTEPHDHTDDSEAEGTEEEEEEEEAAAAAEEGKEMEAGKRGVSRGRGEGTSSSQKGKQRIENARMLTYADAC